MTMTEMFTEELVAEALRQSAGIKSLAAAKLGCSPSTITNYLARYPGLQDVINEARADIADLAEAGLIKNIRDGKEASIFFYLKCQAKDRGYVERQELTGKNGGPLQNQAVPAPDMSNLTDAELETLEALLAKAAGEP